MDPDAEEPFVPTRRESFPEDRAYPSSAPRAHVVERTTNDSRFATRDILREGTTEDFESRRRNKRVRYTIPLRYRRRSQRDEEKGLEGEDGLTNGFASPGKPLSLEREASKASAAFIQPICLEIISTQYSIPDDDGQEVVTLTVKDDPAKSKQEQPRCCESRWKHIQSDAMTFKHFVNQVMRVWPRQFDTPV